MGPRLFSRGNPNWKNINPNFRALLQWGHDFSAVEIIAAIRKQVAAISLQWGHDFSAVEIGRLSPGISDM